MSGRDYEFSALSPISAAGGFMRHILFTTGISLFASVPVWAQTAVDPPQISPAAPAAQQPSTALGKIIMYRGSSIMGAGLACPIRYKGQEVVELARGKYAEWSVPPGRYILTNRTSSVEVSVDPSETRYVRCMIKTGMLTGRADLQIVDEESFDEHRAEYEQKAVTPLLAPTK